MIYHTLRLPDGSVNGAGLALFCTYSTMLAVLVLIICVRRPHVAATWPGWQPRRVLRVQCLQR